MKILVTGGAGFIGSHIVDALVNEGHNVVVIDNLSNGHAQNINTQAKFYEIDICDPKLSEIFEKEKPDIVNHQAAQISIQKSVSDPVFDARQNILGSLNLIHNCVSSKVKKIIYSSSGGAIYGNPEYLPINEEHPVNPISQYGISKHTVEHYLRLYNLQEGLAYTVLRYSNVYGPRQNFEGETGVVAVFSKSLLRGGKPTIFGKGDKTRDYIYVTDVAKANVLAMKKCKHNAYNIGTGVETSDKEMFNILADILGYHDSPYYAKTRKGEIYRTYLDISRASRELKWQPQMSLRQGLHQTVSFYKM